MALKPTCYLPLAWHTNCTKRTGATDHEKQHLGKVLLLPPCALVVFAVVKTDHSHSDTFAQYKAYSWIKVSAEDPLWEDRLTRDVDSQLSAKGWTRVPDGVSDS